MGDNSFDSPSYSIPMIMVFTNTHNTSLYSSAWTPSSSGSYAGTCTFLIILAIIDRCLIAFKATMERHWLIAHLNSDYVTIAGENSEAGLVDTSLTAKTTSLVTPQRIDENHIKMLVRNIAIGPIPWRLKVDLPRAALFLCISGISYLLMLAVMTMNVGYFFSVLAGALFGELAVGRYIH